ncbi:MAG: prolyl oligopeptidase family serine peptidase [Blastocatellia bacterium]
MKSLLQITIVFILAVNISLARQSDEIIPSDSLIMDGIPKISASLAKRVNLYKNAYGYPLAGWDPSRRELWIKALAGTGTWISRVETPGSIPKPLISIQTGGVYDVYFQPQGKYLVYNKDTDGNETFQFFLYDIATRESKPITDAKSRSTEPVWSNAGDRIIYSSSPPNGKGVDLSLINPFESQSNRQLAQGQGNYLKVYDWSPDDRTAVFCDFASNTTSTLWLIDIASGEKTLLSSLSGTDADYYDVPQFGKDGKGIYIITDLDSQFRRLAYLNLATGQYKYLSDHIKWDVEDFKLSPDGKTLAFITNEDGISRLHLLDTGTGKEKMAPSMPVGIISDLRWHSNSIDIGFNFKSPRTPNDIYSLDTNTCKTELWSRGIIGQLDVEKPPKPELIHWNSFDGKPISGFLYRPTGTFTGKRPVIIDIHGGPEEQYRPGFGYGDNYYINELGIVKIFPNVRGSTGYGKAFVNLDNGLLRNDAVKDVGALLDWIRKQPDLDADRVMVQGASHGGYMALSVAANYSDRIKAALADSGPSNLVTFIENTAGWRRDLQRREYGDERDPKTREFLGKIAPVNNVEKIKKPLMIIQGQNDPRVPVAEARLMVTALKKRAIPVWYLLAKDEGHAWTKQSNWDFRLYAIALFVQDHLLKN